MAATEARIDGNGQEGRIEASRVFDRRLLSLPSTLNVISGRHDSAINILRGGPGVDNPEIVD
jgi:hypothetical protein